MAVSGESALAATVGRLAAEGIAVTELSLHLPTLDEVFMTLTGERRVAPVRIGRPERRRQHERHHRGRPSLHAPRAATAPPAAATGATSGSYPRHVVALAKRSLIKMWRTPEALIDVTLQPIIFLLLFTYMFGGAIGGTQEDYLQFLLPGLLGQTHRDGRGCARAEPERRHREGRLRPVPVAADRPFGAAGRRRASPTSAGT